MRSWEPATNACRVLLHEAITGYDARFCFDTQMSTGVLPGKQQLNLLVSPNPASGGVVRVTTDPESHFDRWQVINIAGQVKSMGAVPGEIWEIPVDQLSNGIYFLQVSGSTGH